MKLRLESTIHTAHETNTSRRPGTTYCLRVRLDTALLSLVELIFGAGMTPRTFDIHHKMLCIGRLMSPVRTILTT